MAKATFRYCIVKYHTRHCIRYIKNHMKSYSIISTTHFYSVRFSIVEYRRVPMWEQVRRTFEKPVSGRGFCSQKEAVVPPLLLRRLGSSPPAGGGDTSQSASQSSRFKGTASVRPEAVLILLAALPSVQGIYWPPGAHSWSLLWPLPLRLPSLFPGGGTHRAWCTTVSIVAAMESWAGSSWDSRARLGLRLCRPGRLSHLSRTGIPKVLPSPFLLAGTSRPRASAQTSSLMLAGCDSSRGCFRGRPGRRLMTLFPVLACRCRRLARRIFCTWSKFKECILLTSFWICSTSLRLYLLLAGTPAE